MKQGHYTFANKDDAEEMSKIFKGRVIPDYMHSVYPMYHVWFEYKDGDEWDFIDILVFMNGKLIKENSSVNEHNKRLVQKHNELIEKLNREYDRNRDVNRALEIQIANNITLENKIDVLKKIIKDP